MEAVRITLLGGFRVTAPSGEPIAVSSRKSRALLAYLALHPRGACPRDELAALLWDEHPFRDARHGLRQNLLDLRKALGKQRSAVLYTEGDALGIDLDAVRVDVRDFLRLARLGTRDALAAAANMYAGELLVGLSLNEGAFEDWLMARRSWLHEAACELLLRLATLESSVDKPGAIETCRRLILLDPLDEAAHRLLARLLADTGRPARALRHLRACATHFRTELGVAPEPATGKLAAEISQIADDADGLPGAAVGSPTARCEEPALAVLRFDNLGGEPGLESICRGLAEDVSTQIARHAQVRLRGRDSSYSPRGLGEDARAIGRELEARYLVGGCIQRAGAGLRLTVRLVDAETDRQLWAETYDEDGAGFETRRDELARSIAASVSGLGGHVTRAEMARALRGSGAPPGAHECLLRGLHALRKFEGSALVEARRWFEQAVMLDANDAQGYAWLAWVHWNRVDLEWSDDLALDVRRTYELARKAVELDGAHYLGVSAMGAAHLLRREYTQAFAALERARSLNPSEPDLALVHAEWLVYAARPDRAVNAIEEVMRLNPRHPVWYQLDLARALAHDRRYDEAVEIFSKIPGPPARIHLDLAACHAAMGAIDTARAHARTVLEENPAFSLRRHIRYMQQLPFQRPARLEWYAEGLRSAGLAG